MSRVSLHAPGGGIALIEAPSSGLASPCRKDAKILDLPVTVRYMRGAKDGADVRTVQEPAGELSVKRTTAHPD